MSATAGGRDEVDQIVAAWRHERNDLDLAPVEIFSRISRVARLLDLVRREAFSSSAVEPWEFDVLAALRRAGAPYSLTPGQLLKQTLVTSGTMTNRVDGLEQRGLVRREPSPTDRRAVLVTLTVEGKKTVDVAFETLLEREQRLLTGLVKHDRESLINGLKKLLFLLDDRPSG
ncbi:MAG TPA: MarR family transcriptional regulator [Marmoricola sp.]|nr:MarR family transcriptional regulator [Marmoricola sp.]HNI70963.1 MarR family transcriptional regulator [Marmoricola sp.]HNJ78634.1 MarR family transcriptional regulator [Marmoricola sp.]HNN47825.1 MarR family transcriptional regulator [Marmoricola sp.]HNO38795.1 MarR family transcriptional regulator [Marmoricola sp.]